MLDLLKSKGYEGQDNLEEILQWLETKDIYLGLSPAFDGDSFELIGYQVTYCFGSNPEVQIESQIHTTYRDALTSMLYQLKDYIW